MSVPVSFVAKNAYRAMPVIRGVIDRRVLVNFNCDPDIAATWVPHPFRPKLVRGRAMIGICLIRLRELRPAGLPARLGFVSENAAHRIAVQWDESDEIRDGVFIPRRDSDSLLNMIAGGRLFPGWHHLADFRVWETPNRLKIEMRSRDGAASVRIAARVADALPAQSVFRTLAEASTFFKSGALGWSSRANPGEFDGLELRCAEWCMEPLAVERVETNFFSTMEKCPPGSILFDSAFLMRNVSHEWHTRGRLISEEV
jgi:hypothetical protein